MTKTNNDLKNLINPIRDNNIDGVKESIESGVDINARDKDGWTALHYACYYDNPKALKILLENKANPNLQDKYGYAPLHYACKEGDFDIVKVLLENKANPNLKNRYGKTALDYAKQYKRLKIIDLLENYNNKLIEAEADLEAKDNYGKTALDYAKQSDCKEIIDLKLLIKLTKENKLDDVIKIINLDTFNVNMQNEFGITPLMWFCGNGNFEIVKLLLEKGANIDLKDDWGNKAFTYIINSKSKLIDFLKNYKK